jgi:hypothetical protein
MTGSYYERKRKHLKYYQKIIQVLAGLPEKYSIVDVGGWKGEFLQKTPFLTKTLVDLKASEMENVQTVRGDFLQVDVKVHDIVICLQVLEHIAHDQVTPFARKLFQLAKECVIISVPYKWSSTACKYHIHDPVDEKKMERWTGRRPEKKYIIREENGVERMICIYSI